MDTYGQILVATSATTAEWQNSAVLSLATTSQFNTVRCDKLVLTDVNQANCYTFVINENSLDIIAENKDAKLIFNGVDLVSEITDLKKKLDTLINHVNYMPGGPGYANAKHEFESLNSTNK